MNKGKWIPRGVAVLAAGAALALVPAALPAAAATSAAFPRIVVSVLQGANEVPAADPDGVAIGIAKIDPKKDEVCYFLAQSKLDTVILAHIHKGAVGVNGPVVVPLTAPVDGTSSGCVTVADDLAKDLAANPAGYYFNIHTTAFPGGAIRGQLARH